MRINKLTETTVFFTAAFLIAYVYLKYTGLWVHYRWAGLTFGTAWVATFLALRRNDRSVVGVGYGVLFLVAGVVGLISLLRGGDSSDGFMGSMGIGLAAREFYFHFKTRSGIATTT